MAVDKIIVQYDIETKGFKGKVTDLTKDLKTVENTAVKAGNESTKAFNKASGSVKNTGSTLKGLGGQVNALSSTFQQIGATMGVAFDVQQVVQFGTESVKAFIDAEKNAQLLLFALKGNEAAQGRLLNQASSIQNKTIFDDDSIQQAQTFLATQGRTEDQITKVIDAAIELSTVTGVDLQTAVMQLDGSFEGNIGKLGKLDSGFKLLTKEQLANGEAADLLIKKYKGTAEAMGDTTAGKLAKLKNQFGELQEEVGGKLIPVLNGFVVALQSIGKGDIGGFLKNTFAGQVVTGIGELITGTEKYNETLTDFEKRAIEVGTATDKEIREKFEALGGATNATATEFKKFADEMRSGILQNTLSDLASVLDINEKQFKELTDQTDKYGISVNVTSEAILGLKNATEQQLLVTFLNAQAALGVTREDFDKYVGTIKGIKPLQDDLGASTQKLVGPYDSLTASISKTMKALQDQATLFVQGKSTWESVIEQANLYAQNQNVNVEVIDKITESLKRQTREALLPLGDAMGFVMVQDQAMATRFKMTDEQLLQRDKIFQDLGINQVASYSDTLEQIYKLQADEIRSSDGTLKAIKEINERYANAIAVVQLKNTEQTLNAMGDLAGALSSTLGAIFGDAAKKNAEFAAFIQTLTITEILFKQGAAIANSIEKITTATNPFDVIAGIAGIVTAIGGVFSGITQTIQSQQIPAPPSFFVGTHDTGRGGRLDNKGGFLAINHPNEAIIPASENKSEPGLAKAWITGDLEPYIINRWVAPALAAQEQKHKKEFAESLAASMMLQSGSEFNDFRMVRSLQEIGNISKYGFKHLIDAVKNKPKKRGGYA